MNKKSIGIIGGFLLVLLMLGGLLAGSYNGLVNAREEVNGKWSQVEVATQRRMDLIPGLVETTKGYMNHESETLTAVTNARTQVNNASTPSELADANSEMDSALSRLMVVVESYPDLKASEQFTQLQDELAGTENRISVERKNYNETVTRYNTKIKRFPTVVIANMFGFDDAEYFEAAEGADVAPTIDFNS